MRSGPESFDHPDVQALAQAQQEEMRGLYGGEADIGPTREAAMFVEPDGVFLVVRDDDGAAVACGGIARFDAERAELKRMYVAPADRGRSHDPPRTPHERPLRHQHPRAHGRDPSDSAGAPCDC